MMVIGERSPCYYLHPKAFSSCLLPCPVEEREGECGWVGIWQLAKVNPSQLCYREELTESSKDKDVDMISNIEILKAVDGWTMRRH